MMTTSVRLSAVEIEYLHLIGKLGYATPLQLNRTRFAKGSLTRTYEILRTLASRKLVTGVDYRLPTDSQRGQPRIFYRLSTKGHRTLSSLGQAQLVQPSRIRLKNGPHIQHALELHEPIIGALELQKNYPQMGMRFESEPTLRMNPLHQNGIDTVPDAFVALTNKAAILFEHDRASESLDRIRSKIYTYLSLDQSEEYINRFETSFMRVVFTCSTFKRAEQLLQVTANLLGVNHPQADLFAFGVYLEGDPETFYFAKYWTLPTGESISLLKDEWRGEWK